MIKNLVKHGDGWAIVLDRPIINLLKIDPESPVELTTDGQTITISPCEDERHANRVQSARQVINEKYAKAFKKLAE